jgi:hypothetical protein
MIDEHLKFCRDCKHHRGEQSVFFKCAASTRDQAHTYFLVAGKELEIPAHAMAYCSTMRSPYGAAIGNVCGPEGKLWEPIEVKETANG